MHLTATRFSSVIAGLLLLLLASALLGLVLGPSALSFGDVVAALSQDEGAAADIVWRIRVPRIALAARVGACLSVAGVVVQALLDNLLARGLEPTLPRLFIVDGARALSKAIRNTFGVAAAIQRCQVHKGRNIIERLPQHLHASVKKVLRQAWDQDDADKAERLLRNLARRLEHEEPGVSGSILEGLDEILTVIRLGLPHELRRSLACTNIIENALGTVRQVTRNVKRWRHAEMALRWTATGLLEAQKTFRRLKAYRQLPILRNALQEHLRKAQADSAIETIMKAA